MRIQLRANRNINITLPVTFPQHPNRNHFSHLIILLMSRPAFISCSNLSKLDYNYTGALYAAANGALIFPTGISQMRGY